MNSVSPLNRLHRHSERSRVLIVDQSALTNPGLLNFLSRAKGLEVCGEASSWKSAREAIGRLQPDLVVIGWLKGDQAPNQSVEKLHRHYPEVPMIVLSDLEDVLDGDGILPAGAMDRMGRGRWDAHSGFTKPRFGGSIPEDQGAVLKGVGVRSKGVGAAFALVSDRSECLIRAVESAPVVALSIVIPVYNAELTIETLARELIAELSFVYRLQLVLVDDGSADQSGAVCERLRERYPAIVDFVALARNFGEHNAVMAGLNCVVGDYCVIMDDDLQNPPTEVHRLMEEIQQGHDVVYVQYESKQHSWVRNLGSRFHNWMATRALGKPAALYLSSFKALSRFVVREAIEYTGPDPYLDGIILQITRKIGVVKASHQPRRHGKSGYTLGKLISLWGNMIVSFSLYPLRLLGMYGLLMTMLGTGIGLWTVCRYVLDSIPDPDSYERLTASLWFFRGVQLLFISIVGEYVGRIYKMTKREPQFIVRNRSTGCWED